MSVRLAARLRPLAPLVWFARVTKHLQRRHTVCRRDAAGSPQGWTRGLICGVVAGRVPHRYVVALSAAEPSITAAFHQSGHGTTNMVGVAAVAAVLEQVTSGIFI